MREPTFISLFSGCGGFDLGFVGAGFVPKGAFDIWGAAVANYNHNVGDHAEIWDLSTGTLPRPIQCDVVLAGSPCQGFSTVGKRRLDDPRNSLLRSAVSIAVTSDPKAIVFENVPGLLQGQHKKYWEEATATLRSAGYQLTTLVADARDLGLPQSRRRVLVIAWKGKNRIAPKLETKPAVALSDVLKIDELDNHEPRTLLSGSVERAIAQTISQGQKLCNVRGGTSSVHTWQIPTVFGYTSESERQVLHAVMRLRRRARVRDFGDADPVTREDVSRALGRRVARDMNSLLRKSYLREIEDGQFDLTHTFNGKYRRAAASAASYTVDTRFGDPRCFLHPFEHRGFTVREAARIQGFPDSYVFRGSLADQYRLVGNAVPPPMGSAVARAVTQLIRDQ